MKKLKDFIIAILIIAAVGALVIFLYQNGKDKPRKELAKAISDLSPRGGPPETIDGLIRAIKLYEDQHQRNIKDAAQTGVYWKILAMRYADRGMHNNALEAIEWAIYYNGEDPFLFNLRGLSASILAKNVSGASSGINNEKEHFYNIAENAYLRALELDITYTKPMYALGIMYVFEMNRPQDAIVYLERYLQIQSSDVDAMAVLAMAYYLTEDFPRAIDLYERIANRTNDRIMKEQALNNISTIKGML
ncbi:MAG: tetratricopeptide repeat protein [Treponema sp.]|nr:tetratricopeptide repeat protein [Treponema sp.]